MLLLKYVEISAVPAITTTSHPSDSYLKGGGMMGKLIRNFDWAKTSLGARQDWSQSLLTAVNILLQSPVPIVMLWGADGIMIYNDGYSVFAGKRHPELLGSKVLAGWPEVADFNANVMNNVMAGKTLSYKDQQLVLHRNGQPEDVWMDLNYSPIMDDTGNPTGVFAIVIETTLRIAAEAKQRQAEAALKTERGRLHSLFMDAPAMIAVLSGPNHVFELANPLYLNLVGNRPIVGKTFRKALPEIAGQGIYEILDNVYEHDTPFYAHELAVEIDRDGRGDIQTGYFNFVYQPSHEITGSVDGILIHAVEVTEQVLARKKIEGVAEEQKRLIAMTNQRNELIKLNNAKDEFISLASHQLRTPATAVKQYISLLLNGYGGSITTEQTQFLQTAFDSNERQLKIINDLLRTAQIDSSRYILNKRSQTVSNILAEVIDEMQPAIQLKDQKIVFHGSGDTTKVMVDGHEIKLVFTNLIENASKYSHRGKSIIIILRRSDKCLEVTVSDTGVGINSEDNRRIFEKFTRVDNELSDTVSGSGLGLYWVRKIIKLHNGSIKVTSMPGKGSDFIIKLPL